MTSITKDQGAIIGLLAAIIIVIVLIAAAVLLFLVPFNSLSVDETRTSSLSEADSLMLDLKVDAGDVQVRFVNSSSTAVSLHLAGEQRSGLLWTPRPVNITWDQALTGDVLWVNATVHMDHQMGMFIGNVQCTLDIAQQLATSLTVENSFGEIDMASSSGVNLSSVNLKASLGKIDLSLASGTALGGPLTAETSMGSLNMAWGDVMTAGDATVTLKTSAGALFANVSQSQPLAGNVTMFLTSSLGSVGLDLTISGETSARVVSHADVGSVNVGEQVGFNGNSTDLTSTNYRSSSNIEASCSASAGSVNIKATYGT